MVLQPTTEWEPNFLFFNPVIHLSTGAFRETVTEQELATSDCCCQRERQNKALCAKYWLL